MKCEAKLCGKCGIVHNVEAFCPGSQQDLEKVAKSLANGHDVALEDENYVLELRFEPEKPPEPLTHVTLPDELEYALLKGWIYMEERSQLLLKAL